MMRCFRSLVRLALLAGATVNISWAAGKAQDSADTKPSGPDAALIEAINTSIEKISKGEQTERVAIVSQLLDQRGLTYTKNDFTKGNDKGQNLIADISGTDLPADRWLILGAHLDRVKAGQGAVDNGAGCVTILELASRLKANPLPNLKVTCCFFDLEERGLWGSAAYSSTLKEKPRLYVNVDVFGYGDVVWLHAENEQEPFVEVAKKVDDQNAHSYDFGKDYPPSDHLAFRANGIRSVSFSLLRKDEVDELEKMFGGDRTIRPKILSLIHTPDDLPNKLEPENMVVGIDYMEKTLREWAAAGAPVGEAK